MWKYNYRELLMGKSIDEIHKLIGKPDKIIKEKEYFKMNSKLRLILTFMDDKCFDIEYTEKI